MGYLLLLCKEKEQLELQWQLLWDGSLAGPESPSLDVSSSCDTIVIYFFLRCGTALTVLATIPWPPEGTSGKVAKGLGVGACQRSPVGPTFQHEVQTTPQSNFTGKEMWS